MWNETDTPLAYFISFRSYGTWLHGDKRGAIDRVHNLYRTPIKELERRYAQQEADSRDLVVVYAGLEDKEKAFAWLEKAFADKSVFLVFLKLEPLMQTLHSDPRWKDLERRVGISEG